MADMILEYRVMPVDGELDYETLENLTREKVEGYDDSVQVKEIGPRDVGFGLKACVIKFQVDENCGSEALENSLNELDEVGDVIIELMDRL